MERLQEITKLSLGIASLRAYNWSWFIPSKKQAGQALSPDVRSEITEIIKVATLLTSQVSSGSLEAMNSICDSRSRILVKVRWFLTDSSQTANKVPVASWCIQLTLTPGSCFLQIFIRTLNFRKVQNKLFHNFPNLSTRNTKLAYISHSFLSKRCLWLLNIKL
jgi:hypothetical protein